MELNWEQELQLRGRAAGALEALRATLLALVEERFQTIPEDVAQRVAVADLPTLQAAIRQVVHVQSAQDLRLTPPPPGA